MVVTLGQQYHVGAFFCGTVHLLMDITKLRSDAFGLGLLATSTAIYASPYLLYRFLLWFGLVLWLPQNCLQKNEKNLSTSTSPERNFAVHCLKKNQNAPRPSEHPPVRGKTCGRC